MKNKGKILVLLLLCFLLIPPLSNTWKFNETTIYSTTDGFSAVPKICNDNAGGAIIVYDYFAQRINSSGGALWAPNGTATGMIHQATDDEVQITSDGAGGVIITWAEEKGSYSDIYAQRIDLQGNLLWGPNGRPVCNAILSQHSHQVCSDGAGGAIITWIDHRSGTHQVFAQRISSSNIPLWDSNGTLICNQSGNPEDPQLCSDGAQGAIFAWMDSSTDSIYTQRINSSGAILWNINGTIVPNLNGTYSFPNMLCPDGSHGAIIVGHDLDVVKASRINPSGAILWQFNVSVINPSFHIVSVDMCTDGSGGVIVSWENVSLGGFHNIYVQRINSSGMLHWGPSGVPLTGCVETTCAEAPQICSDMANGAYIIWESAIDLNIEHVDPDGNPRWGMDYLGRGAKTAVDRSGLLDYPDICSNGPDTAFVTYYFWEGTYPSYKYGIYVQICVEESQGGIPGYTLMFLLFGLLAIVFIYQYRHRKLLS